MPFVFISSFYSGKMYRIELPSLPTTSSTTKEEIDPFASSTSSSPSATAASSPTTTTTSSKTNKKDLSSSASLSSRWTFGAILSQLRTVWNLNNGPVPTMDLLYVDNNITNINAAENSSSTTSNAAGDDNINTSSSSNQNQQVKAHFVSQSEFIPTSVIFSSNNIKMRSSSTAISTTSPNYIFLVCKHAHKPVIESLLKDKTSGSHPDDLSPIPETHRQQGTTALISLFTQLHRDSRHQCEQMNVRLKKARTKLEQYASTLSQDVEQVEKLKSGEVASLISVNKENCEKIIGEIREELFKASKLLNLVLVENNSNNNNVADVDENKNNNEDDEDGTTNTTTAASSTLNLDFGSLLSDFMSSSSSQAAASSPNSSETTTSSSNTMQTITPEKCYDFAALARKRVNEIRNRVAEAQIIFNNVARNHFPKLESLRKLPEAFPQAEEIAQRRISLYQACCFVQNQLASEAADLHENIAAFTSKYGAYFPKRILSGFNAPIPSLHVAREPVLKAEPSVGPTEGGSKALLRKYHLSADAVSSTATNNNSTTTNSNSSPSHSLDDSGICAAATTSESPSSLSNSQEEKEKQEQEEKEKQEQEEKEKEEEKQLLLQQFEQHLSKQLETKFECLESEEKIRRRIEMEQIEQRNEIQMKSLMENFEQKEKESVILAKKNVVDAAAASSSANGSTETNSNNNNNVSKNNSGKYQVVGPSVAVKYFNAALSVDIVSLHASLLDKSDFQRNEDNVKAILGELLNYATLKFDFREKGHPPQSVVFNGAVKILWTYGSMSSNSENPNQRDDESDEMYGTVIIIDHVRVVEDSEKKNATWSDRALLELMCMVERRKA